MTKTYYEPLIETLRAEGFKLLRHSKHVTFINKTTNKTVSFSVSIRDRNMANRIIKHAGIEKKL